MNVKELIKEIGSNKIAAELMEVDVSMIHRYIVNNKIPEPRKALLLLNLEKKYSKIKLMLK